MPPLDDALARYLGERGPPARVEGGGRAEDLPAVESHDGEAA
jgi:hypothetical protein